MRAHLAFTLLLLASGCGTLRSQLVPLPANPTPAPSRGRVEVRGRVLVQTDVEPSTASGSAAVYVPRAQIEGAAGIRLHEHFTMRVHYGSFLDAGALRVSRDPHRPPGLAGWYGLADPTLTLPLDHGRTLLAAGLEGGFAILPIRWEEAVFSDCTDSSGEVVPCSGPESDELRVNFLVGANLSASRWLGEAVRLTGTLGVRSQPSLNTAFGQPATSVLGHFVVAVGAEARLQMTDEVSLALEGQWMWIDAPYLLYPTVGLSIGGTFGPGPGEDPRDASTWITDGELAAPAPTTP